MDANTYITDPNPIVSIFINPLRYTYRTQTVS